MKVLNLLYPYIKKVLVFCSDINWTWLKKLITGREFDLTVEEQNHIKKLLVTDYYITLIRRETHLTTYLIMIAPVLLKFKKPGYWSHSLCNVEDEVRTDEDYKLIEATKTGVHWSTFDEVFNCDSVAMLKPKFMALGEYTKMLDDCVSQLGKEYDFILDVANDQKVSCVEVIYQAIILSGSQDKFPNLMRMVKELKNLTPDMFYDCGDFEIAYEVRH